MKKGPLHFLGRKNQSLFGTSVKMQEMDDVELVLQPSAIPESGTASVRARPTVKHLSSPSLDSFQGFAVPTPKVPLLPPVNGVRTNGSDFTCGLNDPDLRNLRPPPMPAPKPPSAFPSMEEEDLSYLRPPQMAPPRPPSICSSGSASTLSASSLPPDLVPEHPKYAAPPPPSERQPKMKTPPPKPIRLSSIPSYDCPPQTPAPPPPVQKPTPSTFNPQNTAKLYEVPKTSILSRLEDPGPKPKQLLLLEDSESVKSTPALVQVDGKTPKLAPPAKTVPEEGKKPSLNISPASPTAAPELRKDLRPEPVGAGRPAQSQQKAANTSLGPSRDPPQGPPSPAGKFSPLLDRKLRNLKGGEGGASREAAAASPLTLLMAAKERDKHRSGPCPQGSGAAVKPRHASSFLTSKSIREESSKSAVENTQTPTVWPDPGPAPAKHTTRPPSTDGPAGPSKAANLATQQQRPEADREELAMPLLPPPPEFGDTDWLTEPPPVLPPPDPPRKPQPTHPSLKPKPPPASKLPPLQTRVSPRPPVEPKAAQSPASPSQSTLLSILQKKMLEMDHKMAPAKDAESGQDDWSSPLSDEDNGAPNVPKATRQSQKNPGVGKTGLDLQELEGKVSTSAIRNEPSPKHQYGCTFTVRPGSKQPITVANRGTS
ncbi:unnamed protein product [Tetraodon nigroviridis]|uniref:(spotted green pufferfish) hypothetical protein n=1 Tax=Tetraodon nigroviridis TaxID=99883 RepID=Q4RXR1_TETNG|nr:unnamed protein product [Tetraodon nigroviridis]